MDILLRNALTYCNVNFIELELEAILGAGEDGKVWTSSRGSAIKAFERTENYDKEVDCYRRLKEKRICEILGLAIPRLVGYSDNHMVVEMTIVQVPFLLDFGKVYLDAPPPYAGDPDIIGWQDNKIREDFGENAGKVFAILEKLKSIGIYYADPHCRNICFERASE